MRKIIAVILIIAQFSFAGFLVSRGSFLDGEERKQMDFLENNGERYLFRLHSFTYNKDGEKPVLSVTLLDENIEAYHYRYFDEDKSYSEIITAENGTSVLGAPLPEPPENAPYIKAGENTFLYDFNYDSLNVLFENETREHFTSYWSRQNSRFSIGGQFQNVFAVAYVYNGDIVFTGLSVGGTEY